MKLVQEDSQVIGEFLEWLYAESQYHVCEIMDDECWPTHLSIEQMLAEYFDINLKLVDQEKQMILEELRNGYASTP